MPRYDFKCEDCGEIKEESMSFNASKSGLHCLCGGTMVRQMPKSISIAGCNRFMRKRGIDAKQDRYYANKSLEEKGKLPKGIKPERGVVNEH